MAGPQATQMISLMKNKETFDSYTELHLPSIKFWGASVSALDEEKCSIVLPYSHNAKNPFNSLYFAAMAGAGELSTGLLCLLHTADRGNWSTLVIGFRAEYFKKATGIITFSCYQGSDVIDTLDLVERSGVPDSLEMISTGVNEEGIEVAKFYVEWSFKQKE